MKFYQKDLFSGQEKGNEIYKETKRNHLLVKELPIDEQPKTRVAQEGYPAVSDAELLSILIGHPSRDANEITLASRLLSVYQDQGIKALSHMSISEIQKEVPGITKTGAIRILAALELGHRVSISQAQMCDIVHGPEDAAHYAMPKARYEQQEHFWIMVLDTKNHITGMPEITKGVLDSSLVAPREVFNEAIKRSAASIILIHNHPSGDPSPSREDTSVTQRLVKAGKILNIPVLDHIILGNNKFISLKEKGLIVS